MSVVSATRSAAGWRGLATMRFRQADRAKWSMAIILVTTIIWGLTDVRLAVALIRSNQPCTRLMSRCTRAPARRCSTASIPTRWSARADGIICIRRCLQFWRRHWQSWIRGGNRWRCFAINVLAAWGCYWECRRLWAWLRMSSSIESTVVAATLGFMAGGGDRFVAGAELPATRPIGHFDAVSAAIGISWGGQQPHLGGHGGRRNRDGVPRDRKTDSRAARRVCVLRIVCGGLVEDEQRDVLASRGSGVGRSGDWANIVPDRAAEHDCRTAKEF